MLPIRSLHCKGAFVCFFTFFPPILTQGRTHWFKQRGRERKEKKHLWREKHLSVASHTSPDLGWGPNLQPKHVHWQGIKQVTSGLQGRHSNQLSLFFFFFFNSKESVLYFCTSGVEWVFFSFYHYTVKNFFSGLGSLILTVLFNPCNTPCYLPASTLVRGQCLKKIVSVNFNTIHYSTCWCVLFPTPSVAIASVVF